MIWWVGAVIVVMLLFSAWAYYVASFLPPCNAMSLNFWSRRPKG